MGTYDNAEAKQILALNAGRLVPHRQAKHQESGNLLQALAALNGFAGFIVNPDGPGVEVQLGQRMVHVRYGVSEERFFIVTQDGRLIPVQLWFDPALNRFEGETADTYRNPTPGEPIPPRSALAVLVEAVCAALAS